MHIVQHYDIVWNRQVRVVPFLGCSDIRVPTQVVVPYVSVSDDRIDENFVKSHLLPQVALIA